MHKIVHVGLSVVAGVLAFIGVGAGVTELLAPHIWPSALLGLPAGLLAGAITMPLTYLSVAYLEERQTTGHASERTRRRLQLFGSAITAFLLGGGLALGLLFAANVGIATGMVISGGIGAVVATAVVGILATRQPPRPRQDPNAGV
jgi:hypothetical protein